MLLQTPQMLKKSEINKGNAINNLTFTARMLKKPGAGDAIGGKEEPALIVVS